MKSLILCIFCTVFFPLAAYSLENPKLYVHGFGGANYLTIKIPADEIKIGTKPGYMFGMGIGFQFINTRIELEGTYRFNEYEKDKALGPNIFFDEGHLEKIAYFVNFFYDLPMDLLVNYLRPYVGLGFGHSFDKEKIIVTTYPYGEIMWKDTFKTNEMDFGAQVILGAGLPMTEHSVTKMEYRFMKDRTNIENHSFVLNFDWAF